VRRCGLLLAVALLAGCELREVQIAEIEDVPIAEVILRAHEPVQQAWLHRTRAKNKDLRVENAIVRVHTESGDSVQFKPVAAPFCFISDPDTLPANAGSCYQTDSQTLAVLPERTYRLTVTTSDGRRMTGNTTVPADFNILRPVGRMVGPSRTVHSCFLAPMGSFEVSWTRSTTAWVYAAEITLRGLRRALMPHGIEIDDEPVRLFGLALSAQDTTIHVAREFGVFDRFDDDLTAALVFLQDGLPGRMNVEGVIAAADRNYVNWERGGSFNPSGFVRVPSLHGQGTGVFGSIVPKPFSVFVGIDEGSLPPC
jgi:hypothetical protein